MNSLAGFSTVACTWVSLDMAFTSSMMLSMSSLSFCVQHRIDDFLTMDAKEIQNKVHKCLFVDSTVSIYTYIKYAEMPILSCSTHACRFCTFFSICWPRTEYGNSKATDYNLWQVVGNPQHL